MGVGGPARYFMEARDEAAVLAAFEWARTRRLPLRVLGGGSNLVVADEGVDGLVVKIALRGVGTRGENGAVELTAAAGEPWDELVRESVERGWAGSGRGDAGWVLGGCAELSPEQRALLARAYLRRFEEAWRAFIGSAPLAARLRIASFPLSMPHEIIQQPA